MVQIRFGSQVIQVQVAGAAIAARQAALATAAADSAASSAAFAESVSGPTYPDTAAGLAATTDGQSFAVDNGDGTVTIYLNDGGTAVEQRTLATTAALASTSGAGLVGVAGGGTLQEAITFTPSDTITNERTLVDKARDVVSILDYIPVELHAAIRDGTSIDDVVTYIETAMADAAVIQFPEGRFFVSRCAFVPSNTRLVGSGPNTVIYNPQTDANPAFRAGFGTGHIHPAAFDYANQGTDGNLPCHDIADVTAGDTSVTLLTAGDDVNYSPGQFVLVRSIAEQPHVGTNRMPHYGQFTKVRSVAGGVVTLEDAILESITAPCLSPLGTTVASGSGRIYDFVENVFIENMMIDARNVVWSLPAVYNSALRNIWCRADGAILLNAWVKSAVSGLRGTFMDRAVEVKCLSSSSVFEDIKLEYAGSGDFTAGFQVGEQSQDIVVRNVNVSVGPTATTGGPALSVNGRNILVENSTFTQTGTTGTVGGNAALIMGNNFTGYGPRNITFRNITLVSNAQRNYHLQLGTTDAAEKPEAVTLHNVNYIGTPSIKQVNYLEVGAVEVIGVSSSYSSNASTRSEAPEHLNGRVLLTASDFAAMAGTPEIVSFAGERGKCWAMDAAADESVAAAVPVPRWANSVRITGYMTNLGTGTGDVVSNIQRGSFADGEDMATAHSVTSTTFAAPAQNVLSVVVLASSPPVVPGGLFMIRWLRDADNAADTLANDFGFIAMELEFFA